MPVEALKSYLSSQPPGPLAGKEQLESLLLNAWDHLEGSADGGMQSGKLKNRIEQATWNSPILCFQIERHGATVNGSVYAEMQQWEIDCEKGIANYDRFNSRRRQVADKQRPLKVAPIAKEIANVIRSGSADSRGEVVVTVGGKDSYLRSNTGLRRAGDNFRAEKTVLLRPRDRAR